MSGRQSEDLNRIIIATSIYLALHFRYHKMHRLTVSKAYFSKEYL